jgi:hercynylcysteine S-oxide lyase
MATATSVPSAGDGWSSWATRRPPTVGIHLDSAAAGRSSFATLDAVTAHTHREASDGA